MKKSLLIAPALGVLVLAAAGSVGGTVAWFSANTAWDINASEFAVTKLDGNLKAEITANAGHGTSSANHHKVTVSDNMTDASANVASAPSVSIFSLHGITSGETYHDHSSNWVAEAASDKNGNKAVYWAVSWDVVFTFEFPQNTTDVNLYFDVKAGDAAASYAQSKVGNADWGAPGNDEAAKGFRLAFVGQTSGTTSGNVANTRVWAPFRASTESDKVAYVASTSATGAYSEGDVIYSDANNQSFKTGTNDQGATCLGVFKSATPNTSSSIKFTCVAWFEGTDPNVDDNKDLGKVTATLNFFTRQNKPAQQQQQPENP